METWWQILANPHLKRNNQSWGHKVRASRSRLLCLDVLFSWRVITATKIPIEESCKHPLQQSVAGSAPHFAW